MLIPGLRPYSIMTSFVTKEVLNLRSVGEVLRKRRFELGLTLEDISTATRVGVHYLGALEQDQFERLPGAPYAKEFIKRYAECVGIGEMSNIFFERIQHVFPKPTHVQRVSIRDLMVFSKVARYSAVATVLATLFLVAAFQLYSFIAPPEIDLAEPVVFTNHRMIDIAGRVKNAQVVLVNDEEVPVDASGYFRANVPLVAGINTVRVIAKNSREQETDHPVTVYFSRQTRERHISAR